MISYEAIAIAEHQIDIDNTPEQQMIRMELMDSVRREINKLPAKRCDIINKYYAEYKKPEEIAKELQLSVRTVETHIYLALKSLRKNISKA